MPQTILIDKDLEVKIVKLIQFPVPGLFDDCATSQDKSSMARNLSIMIKEEYMLDSIYVVEPFSVLNSNNLVACLMTVSSAKPFESFTSFHYQMNIFWFQEAYVFPISAEVTEKIALIPFREIATKEKNPF